MMFEVSGKVAIVTGAATGMGLCHAKQLLKEMAKGVTLVDISDSQLQKAVVELEKEFGAGKVLPVKADISNYEEFENAFIKCIEKFKNVDILINNAGIMNGSKWELEIAINLNGTINGVLLAMDKYFPTHKTSNEGLILNIASIAGTDPFPSDPTYAATKAAVIGLTRSWGISDFYEETNVRIVCICPGVTSTQLFLEGSGRNLGEKYEKYFQINKEGWLLQEPEFVVQEAMKVIKHAPNGTIWVVEGGESVYQYVVPERDPMKQNVLEY